MDSSKTIAVGVVSLLGVFVAGAEIYAIPAGQVDSQKVYWGATTGFEKAGEVIYDEVIKATPEYKQLKREKIERGTGKYWILMSQASERAARAIAEVGQNTDYDLIVTSGYLGKLSPAIPVEDITALVIRVVEGEDSKDAGQKPAAAKDAPGRTAKNIFKKGK